MIRWRASWLEVFLVGYAALDAMAVLASDAPHRLVVAVLAAGSLLVLCGGRHLPLAVSLVSFSMLLVAILLSPSSVGLQFLGILVVFSVVGFLNRGWAMGIAASAGWVLLAVSTLGTPAGGGWSDFWLSSIICEALLVIGSVLGRRAQQVRQLRLEATVAAEHEVERRTSALVEERARIARELHDVVSHGLTVVVVQAQAARSALDDVAEARARDVDVARHLAAVEGTARDALGEMRRMLGLLRLDELENGGGAPDPPAPGLPDLLDLVARTRAAGVPVDAELPPPCTALGDGLELTVFRVVQEALTNVVRHSPGARTSLTVHVTQEAVEVLVRSDAVPASPGGDVMGGGRGLAGMRERVATYAGVLIAGPEADGAFQVRARLPLAPGREVLR